MELEGLTGCFHNSQHMG